MTLAPYVSTNSARLAHKTLLIKHVTAWIRLKTDHVALTNVENSTNKIVFRKKYNELPAAMKLSDGSNAPGLGEWLGGINAPRESLDSQTHPSSSKVKGMYFNCFLFVLLIFAEIRRRNPGKGLTPGRFSRLVHLGIADLIK